MTDPQYGSPGAPSARRFVGNASILTAGEFIARAISFAATLAVAHVLGPAAFGAVTVTQTIMLFFAILSDGGLTSWSQRQLIVHRDRAAEIIADTLATQLVLAAGAAVIVVVLANAVPLPQLTSSLLLLALPFLFSQAFSTLYALRGLEHVRAAAGFSILMQLLAAAIAVSLVVTTHAPGWAIAAMWIGELVTDVIVLALLFRLVPLRGLMRSTVRAVGPRSIVLLRSSGSLLLALGLFQYTASAPTIALGLLSDTREAGVYGAAIRPLVLMPILVSVVSYALVPELVRRLAADRRAADRFLAEGAALVLRLTLLITIGLVIFAGVAVDEVYGPAFHAAGFLARLTLFLVPIFALSGLLDATALAAGRPTLVMRAHACAALVCTAGLPLAIILGRATGAAVMQLVSATTVSLALFVVGRAVFGTLVWRAAVREVLWAAPVGALTLAAGLLSAPLLVVAAAWVVGAVAVEIVRGRPTHALLRRLRPTTEAIGARESSAT